MGLNSHHYLTYGIQGGSENMELPAQRVGTQRKGIQITIGKCSRCVVLDRDEISALF